MLKHTALAETIAARRPDSLRRGEEGVVGRRAGQSKPTSSGDGQHGEPSGMA